MKYSFFQTAKTYMSIPYSFKKYKNSGIKGALVLFSTCLLASCSSFLDVTPLSDNSVENFYKTEREIDQAVVAIYDGVQTLVRPGYLDHFGEVVSDNSYNFATTPNGGAYADFDNFNLQTNNNFINRFWEAAYNGVQRANVVLNRIEGVEIEATKKNILKGEALFLRALTYSYLTQIWGDVPLVLDETKNPMDHIGRVRDSRAAVTEQIIQDLTAAVGFLPESYSAVDEGRVTKGAAHALLARLYLIEKDYAKVIQHADHVIGSGQYRLDDSYENFFNPNAGSAENIFYISFKSGTNSEGFPYQNINHDYNNTASYDLRATYKDDPRLAMNVAPTNIGTFYSKKIHNEEVNNDNTIDVRIVVIRYADVLLMKAEALNQQSFPNAEALKLLNAVRDRADMKLYSSADVASSQDFQTKLMAERRIEFAFENLRWFDLIRTGTAVDVMSNKGKGGQNENSASALPYTFDKAYLLFPIPQAQIDASANSLTQNPGYN